jgi:hypothetical protein
MNCIHYLKFGVTISITHILLTAAEDPLHLGSLFSNYTIYILSYCLQLVSLYLDIHCGVVITKTRYCAQFDLTLCTPITNGGSCSPSGAHSAVGLFMYLFI